MAPQQWRGWSWRGAAMACVDCVWEPWQPWLHAPADPPRAPCPLPAGGLAAAALHMARSVCRRAERAVVPLVRDELTDAAVAVYLNRLSDYLFTAARFAALKAGEPETTWIKASEAN